MGSLHTHSAPPLKGYMSVYTDTRVFMRVHKTQTAFIDFCLIVKGKKAIKCTQYIKRLKSLPLPIKICLASYSHCRFVEDLHINNICPPTALLKKGVGQDSLLQGTVCPLQSSRFSVMTTISKAVPLKASQI